MTRLTLLRTAALALLLPGTALAATDADCTAQVGAVLALTGPVATTEAIRAEGDWCLVEAPAIEGQQTYDPSFRADHIRFRLTGEPAAPLTVDLEVEDLRMFVITRDDPFFDWLLQRQAGPIATDVTLAMSRDAALRTLAIDRLHIDFPLNNDILLTAAFANIDVEGVARNPEIAISTTLTSLDLTIVTEGLFEAYVLAPLATLFLYDTTDPEADVAALKAAATAIIRRLPDSLTDAASRTAATDLIADMPHPWGRLHLTLASDAGIGAVRLTGPLMTGVPDTLDGWMPLFDGVRVALTYTRSPMED